MRLRALLGTPVTVVWLVLVAATVLSWSLGAEHSLHGGGRIGVSVLIIAVALFKVRLVGLWFMELRGAPRLLRLLFEGYCAVVAIALIAAYLAGS